MLILSFSLCLIPIHTPMAKYNQKPEGKGACQCRSTSWGTSTEQGGKGRVNLGKYTAAIQPNGFPSESGYVKVLPFTVRPYRIRTHLFPFVKLSTHGAFHSPGTLLSQALCTCRFLCPQCFSPRYPNGLFPHLLQVSAKISHHHQRLSLATVYKNHPCAHSPHPFLVHSVSLLLLYFSP